MKRPPTRRGVLPVLLAAAGLVVAVAVSLVLRAPEPPLEARVQSVASELRCPTCVSQSVAESDSPMAQSMRRTVRRQLRAGATDDQVVEWFRARYGDGVVLRPRADGPGAVLWAAPAVALLGGLAVAAVAVRRSRGAARGARPGVVPPAQVPVRRLVAVGAVLALVGVGVPVLVGSGGSDDPAAPGAAGAAGASGEAATERPGTTGPADASAWAALARDLESRQAYPEAAGAWQKAADLRPRSMAIRTRLAFDLLRGGRPGAAADTAVPAARRPGDHQPLAVLVLGLARRAEGDPRADRTLRRFLRIAPGHPAASEVRRLLGEDP